MEFGVKKFGVFFGIALAIIFTFIGVKETYVVGNRSEGMVSTFPILIVASFILAVALMTWFDGLIDRIKRAPKDKEDV